MRRIWVLMITAVTALGGVAATEADTTAYEPPYAAGPTGGDQYNLARADEDGRLVLGRLYPIPSSIGCRARGGFVNFEIRHHADAPVAAVTVDHVEAAVDPYTFVSINVLDDDGRFLASQKSHGPIVGTGTFEVDVHWRDDDTRVRDIRIQVGLELTSACPSADGGTLRIPAVTVTDR